MTSLAVGDEILSEDGQISCVATSNSHMYTQPIGFEFVEIWLAEDVQELENCEGHP
jgi:hypothetical protein